jgi:hypothetical protein
MTPIHKTILRSLFWLTLLATLALDWMPHEQGSWRSDNDPNILTFSLLTLLICLAYNNISKFFVFIILSLLGVIIELVQMIPMLHRYSDVFDIFVDMSAILVGLVIAGIADHIV